MILFMKTSVLFWLWKAKENSTGKAPIYCSITVNKVKANPFSTGIFIDPLIWNSKAQTIAGDDFNTRKLEFLRSEIEKLAFGFETIGRDFNAQYLADLITKRQLLTYSMVQCYQKYMVHLGNMVAQGKRSPDTIKKEEYRYKNLIKFLNHKRMIGIEAGKFKPAVVDEFITWAQSINLGANDHIQKHIQAFRRVLSFAFKKELIGSNPIASVECKYDEPKEIIYLEPEQITQLEGYNFASSELQKTADKFLLACYTGFDYGDGESFDLIDIKLKVGRKWVYKDRQKGRTKKIQKAILPILPGAERIINKYMVGDLMGERLELPKMKNQTYNRYLKEISAILGFPQHLTTHVGRKTFGMLMLNDGFSIEAVSRMLGHGDIKTTQRHYAKVLERRIHLEVERILPKIAS